MDVTFFNNCILFIHIILFQCFCIIASNIKIKITDKGFEKYIVVFVIKIKDYLFFVIEKLQDIFLFKDKLFSFIVSANFALELSSFVRAA